MFKRYLRPEKDYLSFSLLYKNGDRSLDLVSKTIDSGFIVYFYPQLDKIVESVIVHYFSYYRYARTKLRQKYGLQGSRH